MVSQSTKPHSEAQQCLFDLRIATTTRPIVAARSYHQSSSGQYFAVKAVALVAALGVGETPDDIRGSLKREFGDRIVDVRRRQGN